jgi:hypothetical protein
MNHICVHLEHCCVKDKVKCHHCLDTEYLWKIETWMNHMLA